MLKSIFRTWLIGVVVMVGLIISIAIFMLCFRVAIWILNSGSLPGC